MSAITVLYVLLIAAGVAWVACRVMTYMRSQRERESRWALMASDELLTRYSDTRKKEKGSAGTAKPEQAGRSRPPRPAAKKNSYREGQRMGVTKSDRPSEKAG